MGDQSLELFNRTQRAQHLNESLLVDLDLNLRNAQIEDLSDVIYSTNNSTRVRPATYREAAQSDLVVITAASKHTLGLWFFQGKATVDYMSRNTSMIREVMEAMKPFRPDTVLLVVVNPADLLSSIAKDMSGLPPSQVIGTGTTLGTYRLRGMIASRTLVSPSAVDAFVVGRHGDDQVVTWSSASIGAVPIADVQMFNALDRNRIELICKHRLQSIIRGKGSAPFEIASVAANLCCSVILDKHEVYPVSHFQEQYECCLIMPAVIGRKGILSSVPLSLDAGEEVAVKALGKLVKESVESIQRDWW
ncbi:L-lactate dehydrogenase [Fusarium oxysporum f. sp. lycopersici 4287]|uniref:L-lactate dehydrogenase n=2 Tax=Fusarium oxysporum f. sp. lycopersici (strain 4287 / CBS 123668 / FGSC 9935 / NRRL 34936) TaxID=426428 RepID=A0A0J9W7Y6_FUSO4|nr:L-lactate dehydrogenase [Fusarium oxysporum f. sp. lycopersici 4287]XP_018256865.1 L-lactate dehydrogenase [Fusarium oxysporum f. sp. lycopersici 4287]KNB04868.1 L-lactate dehydrogenase [Fusarium oxysporum f. sp. lycopersici 4287]KNB18820.1 L-lactate dehydrogenase [Fusarium oxysporum f. sp. lycopersici 4287]